MDPRRCRAHHIGSFLRPPQLHDARRRFAAGEIDAQALRAVEDACIAEAVLMQERLGFALVTDGEFRRMSWRSVIVERVPGFGVAAAIGDLDMAHDELGEAVRIGNAPIVTQPIPFNAPIAVEDARFLARSTRRSVKVALPSPSYMHFLRGDKSFTPEAYADRQAYFNGLVALYCNELDRLSEEGVAMVQLDEVAVTAMCDPDIRAKLRNRGDDPEALVQQYRAMLAAIFARKPLGMTIGVHMCRGNFGGRWLASGGYAHLADSFMGPLAPDLWLLEFDSERAGDFGVLADIDRASAVILGLVSTKTGVMEDAAAVRARVAAAASVISLDHLGISPQCGFASHVAGNPITPEIQERKLQLVKAVARDVWGDDGSP